jgi:hypothetical protein
MQTNYREKKRWEENQFLKSFIKAVNLIKQQAHMDGEVEKSLNVSA